MDSSINGKCFKEKEDSSVVAVINYAVNTVEYCLTTRQIYYFRFSLNVSVCFTNKDSGLSGYAGNISTCAPLFLL